MRTRRKWGRKQFMSNPVCSPVLWSQERLLLTDAWGLLWVEVWQPQGDQLLPQAKRWDKGAVDMKLEVTCICIPKF